MRKTIAIGVVLISMIALSVAAFTNFAELGAVAVIWGAPAGIYLLFYPDKEG